MQSVKAASFPEQSLNLGKMPAFRLDPDAERDWRMSSIFGESADIADSLRSPVARSLSGGQMGHISRQSPPYEKGFHVRSGDSSEWHSLRDRWRRSWQTRLWPWRQKNTKQGHRPCLGSVLLPGQPVSLWSDAHHTPKRRGRQHSNPSPVLVVD
jgi:hypothetical protein